MYLYSDLTSISHKAVNVKPLNYKDIDLLNKKNMKDTMDNLKNSLNQKQKFFQSYNETSAIHGLNKGKSVSESWKGVNEKIHRENLFKKKNNLRLSNTKLTISQDDNKIFNTIRQEEEIILKNDKTIPMSFNSKFNKISSKMKMPLINITPVNGSLENKTFNFQEYKDNERESVKFNTLSHSMSTINNHRSQSYGNFILSDCGSKEKTTLEFNKVFERILNPILEVKFENKPRLSKVRLQMNKEREKFAEKGRANGQIVELKDKLHFMKGIMDYSIPKILKGKIKIFKETFFNNKGKELAILDTKDDRSFLKPKLKNSIISLKSLKNKPEKNNFHFHSPHFSNFKNFNEFKKVKVISPLHIRSLSNFGQ